jgi:transcriptional regulator of acetoin/glycerol metabolism
MAAMVTGNEVTIEDVRSHVIRAADTEVSSAAWPDLSDRLREAEREYIREALDYTGGAREQTAHLLGITRSTLWRKIRQHRLGRGTVSVLDGLWTAGGHRDVSQRHNHAYHA